MDVVSVWLVTLKDFHGLLKFPLEPHLKFSIYNSLPHMEKILFRWRAIHAIGFMLLTNCENTKQNTGLCLKKGKPSENVDKTL